MKLEEMEIKKWDFTFQCILLDTLNLGDFFFGSKYTIFYYSKNQFSKEPSLREVDQDEFTGGGQDSRPIRALRCDQCEHRELCGPLGARGIETGITALGNQSCATKAGVLTGEMPSRKPYANVGVLLQRKDGSCD